MFLFDILKGNIQSNTDLEKIIMTLACMPIWSKWYFQLSYLGDLKQLF